MKFIQMYDLIITRGFVAKIQLSVAIGSLDKSEASLAR